MALLVREFIGKEPNYWEQAVNAEYFLNALVENTDKPPKLEVTTENYFSREEYSVHFMADDRRTRLAISREELINSNSSSTDVAEQSQIDLLHRIQSSLDEMDIAVGTGVVNMENEIASSPEWDVFICHASEDKDDVARPLAQLLEKEGLKVWFDEEVITLGDRLHRSIDEGIANSRFGVVILSPHFFAKEWAKTELDGLNAKEIAFGKTILPVWHKVKQADVVRNFPTLADKKAASTADGLESVAGEILHALGQKSSGPARGLAGSVLLPTPAGLSELRFSSEGTSSNGPDFTEGYAVIKISTPQTIHSVSVASWHPKVKIGLAQPLVQVPGGSEGILNLKAVWSNEVEPPKKIKDELSRAFVLQRPRDPGEEWTPIYITFEMDSGEVVAAVTYIKVSAHPKGFPRVEKLGADAPSGWIAAESI